MEQLLVSGEKKLDGAVTVHGAKNSALPILAAAILVKGECIIHNCPRLSDVLEAINILKGLGCKAELEGNTAVVDASTISGYSIDEQTMRSMRSSIIFLGALVSRMGIAQVYYPGGCEIGTRPVDLHIKGFTAMGAKIEQGHGFVEAECSKLHGADIYLDFPSVGATENLIMAASLAEGTTVIENAAAEPEIINLADFINAMGGDVKGAGTDTVHVNGVCSLHGANHVVIPDRIEAGTFAFAAAATHGSVVIKNVITDHLKPVIAKLEECGISTEINLRSLSLVLAQHIVKAVSQKLNGCSRTQIGTADTDDKKHL